MTTTLNKTARLLRHRWLDEGDVRRVITPEVSARLAERVTASEMRHSGEIRICVESSLPMSYLWRSLRQGLTWQQVARERAVMLFAKLRVWDTQDKNGVLIYLLLAERQIELVADRGLEARVAPADWQALVDRMATLFQTVGMEEGLNQAVDEITTLLVAHYPESRSADDQTTHRLPNEPALLG